MDEVMSILQRRECCMTAWPGVPGSWLAVSSSGRTRLAGASGAKPEYLVIVVVIALFLSDVSLYFCPRH